MKLQKIALIALSAFALSACDSGSSPSVTPAASTPSAGAETTTKAQVSLDVVDGNWHYYKLDDLLGTALTPVDPAVDTEWDVAFKTTSVKINGGAAGAGSLTGALALRRDSYFNGDGSNNLSVYQDGRDPVAEVALTFDTVTKDTDTSALAFEAPAEKLALEGEGNWWSSSAGFPPVVSFHDDKYWLLRSQAGDSYAKLRVVSADNSGYQGALTTVKFGIQLQASGANSFAAELQQDVTFVPSPPSDLRGPDLCVDFDLSTSAPTTVTVDCSTANWDFKITANTQDSAGAYAIRLNTDTRIEGSVKTLAEVNAVTDGTAVSAHAWTGEDTVEGVFSKNTWYAYTGNPDHKILPNYRVYLIKDGSDTYKLQLQSYYSAVGVARNLLVNVEKL